MDSNRLAWTRSNVSSKSEVDGTMDGWNYRWTCSLFLSSSKEELIVKEAHIMGRLGQLVMGGSIGQLVSLRNEDYRPREPSSWPSYLDLTHDA